MRWHVSTALVLLPRSYPYQEISQFHDKNAFKLAKSKQVIIASYEKVGLPDGRQGKKKVVVMVSAGSYPVIHRNFDHLDGGFVKRKLVRPVFLGKILRELFIDKSCSEFVNRFVTRQNRCVLALSLIHI